MTSSASHARLRSAQILHCWATLSVSPSVPRHGTPTSPGALAHAFPSSGNFLPLPLASPKGTHSPRQNAHPASLLKSFLPAQSSSLLLYCRLDFTFLCSLGFAPLFLPQYRDPVLISASHATQGMMNLCHMEFFHWILEVTKSRNHEWVRITNEWSSYLGDHGPDTKVRALRDGGIAVILEGLSVFWASAYREDSVKQPELEDYSSLLCVRRQLCWASL